MRNGRFATCVAWSGAAAIVLLAATARAQSVEELVEKNLKAQGGRAALLGLKALERKGDVNVDGSFGQMKGTVEEISIPWKKAFRSMDLEVFALKEAYDGKTAWRDGMMGLQDLEGEEANQIKQAIELNPFVTAAEKKSKLEKLDDETIDDVAYSVIQMTPADRPPIKFYLDKKTDQIALTRLKQNNPQFGEIEITLETGGYEKFGPVTLPTKNKLTLGEIFEVQTTYTETKVDGKVDEKIFDKPMAEEPAKTEASDNK
jgi:hypothetical protein